MQRGHEGAQLVVLRLEAVDRAEEHLEVAERVPHELGVGAFALPTRVMTPVASPTISHTLFSSFHTGWIPPSGIARTRPRISASVSPPSRDQPTALPDSAIRECNSSSRACADRSDERHWRCCARAWPAAALSAFQVWRRGRTGRVILFTRARAGFVALRTRFLTALRVRARAWSTRRPPTQTCSYRLLLRLRRAVTPHPRRCPRPRSTEQPGRHGRAPAAAARSGH